MNRFGSWNTTLMGIGTILVAVGDAVLSYTDGDPSTIVNLAVVVAAVTAGLGLIFSRDNNKSSKTLGV
jgi:hypothetical protein